MATPTELNVILEYAAALSATDGARMSSLRSPNFVLDLVHRDAFESEPLSPEEAEQFWQAWFTAFPDCDYELTRTIAGQGVVASQWIFTGHHTGRLESRIFAKAIEPMGRAIRLRGVSVYDVRDEHIERETVYLDLATLMVELGAEV